MFPLSLFPRVQGYQLLHEPMQMTHFIPYPVSLVPSPWSLVPYPLSLVPSPLSNSLCFKGHQLQHKPGQGHKAIPTSVSLHVHASLELLAIAQLSRILGWRSLQRSSNLSSPAALRIAFLEILPIFRSPAAEFRSFC